MAATSPKRTPATKAKSSPATKKKTPTAKAAAKAPAKPAKYVPRPGTKAHARLMEKAALPPLPPGRVRHSPKEKIFLPIKGYGRYNGFQVIEQLYGKSTAQLKEILAYEQSHQGRRMIIDRIEDMLRRAGAR